MSTMQRMTLIGLYNYEQSVNADLFENLNLPDGYDKTTFVNSLLLEHGEKCVLYTNPDFFMQAVGIWSSKYALELSRIHEALVAEYNPIWNYDRNEEWSDDATGKTSSETSGDRKTTSETNAGRKNVSETTAEHTDENESETGRRNVTETDAKHSGESVTNAGHKAQDNPNYTEKTTNDFDVTTSNITDATTEHEVSADNSGTYQPDWKETRDAGSQKTENDGTITKEVNGTTQNLVEASNSKTQDTANDTSKSVDVGKDDSKSKGSAEDNSKTVQSGIDNSKTVDSGEDNSKTVGTSADKSKHSGHLWGNIGVTTSASMVTEVVEQRFKISLYGTATRMFANELLIGIW